MVGGAAVHGRAGVERRLAGPAPVQGRVGRVILRAGQGTVIRRTANNATHVRSRKSLSNVLMTAGKI